MATYINPNSIKSTGRSLNFLVGSSEAPRVHGFTEGVYDRAPRFKNQFFVHFQFAPNVVFGKGLEELKGVTYKVSLLYTSDSADDTP